MSRMLYFREIAKQNYDMLRSTCDKNVHKNVQAHTHTCHSNNNNGNSNRKSDDSRISIHTKCILWNTRESAQFAGHDTQKAE